LLRAALEASHTELALQGHAWLVVDLLERGDQDGVDAQIEAFTVAARELGQPLYLWQVAIWRVMRGLLAGHLNTADRLATEALAAGIRPERQTASQYFAAQSLVIRREQARMPEFEESAREMVERNPLRPGWGAAYAMVLVEAERLDEAQAQLDLLAARGFTDVPRDGDWIASMALLADVAAAVGDAQRAALLHDLLAPYGDRAVVLGMGAACLGSASRYLGRAALAAGRRTLGLAHLERALQANAAMRAPVELAHTQLDYALALDDGPHSRVLIAAARRTANELHLPAVARRAERTSTA
jgi:hypothetical protein